MGVTPCQRLCPSGAVAKPRSLPFEHSTGETRRESGWAEVRARILRLVDKATIPAICGDSGMEPRRPLGNDFPATAGFVLDRFARADSHSEQRRTARAQTKTHKSGSSEECMIGFFSPP